MKNNKKIKTVNVILAAIATLTLSLLTFASPSTIGAEVTSESCFNFDIPTNTITTYYVHESGNPSNNTCPKNVHIPSTINGVPVNAIGHRAFDGKGITSVTIPNSVTTIDSGAFTGNNLTSVVIPASVTDIGTEAFSSNKLSTLTISSSLLNSINYMAFHNNSLKEVYLTDSIVDLVPMAFTSQNAIGGQDAMNIFFSGDQQLTSELFDGIFFARVYTNNDLSDDIVYEYDLSGGYDLNGNDFNDPLGGHIINPAYISVSFQDSNGTPLPAPANAPTMYTGYNNVADKHIASYLVKDNIEADFSYYYRAGDNPNASITPPNLPGYETPPPALVNYALNKGENNITFTYNPISPEITNYPVQTVNTGSLIRPNVASLPSPFAEHDEHLLLEIPEGGSITCSNTLKESEASSQDDEYSYPLGLINFCFNPEEDSSEVSLTFPTTLEPSEVIPRKYNYLTDDYYDLPASSNYAISKTTLNNKPALKLTYTIEDNGVLDLDAATGSIKDPVGLAVKDTDNNPLPLTELASTGDNKAIATVIGVALLMTSVTSLTLLSKYQTQHRSS